MNKTSVVMAVSLAFALPFAAHANEASEPSSVKVGTDTTVTLSGLFAVGLKQSSVTNSTRAVRAETRVDDNTSRFIISGKTDLGDGLRAIFRIESRFTADSRPGTTYAGSTSVNGVTGWADGDTWVGLGNGWGQVVFGKATLYYTDTISLPYFGQPAPGEGYRAWDANGLSTFNLLSSVGTNVGPIFTTGNTRSQNVIRYDSPKFYDGFDASLAYTKNASGGEVLYATCNPTTPTPTATCSSSYTAGDTVYGRMRYNNGPLTASISVLNQRPQGGLYNSTVYNGPLNTRAYRAGVAYTLPMDLKLGVVYDNTSIDNGVSGTTLQAKRGVWEIPLSYNWGKHAAYLTYTLAGATSNIDSSGAKQLTLGYDYALSKTTFLGVYYTQLKNDTKGFYSPFLTSSSFGGDGVAKAGEGWRQISTDMNFWF
jgi:predicted porin